MNKSIFKITFTACFYAVYCHGEPVASYTFRIDKETTPHYIQAYHGEEITLNCHFPTNTTFTEAKFHWQTNGMNEIWFQDTAQFTTNTLTYTFTPENDIGSDLYRYFLAGHTDQDGITYRANGTISLAHSPGFIPNSIPFPQNQYQIILYRLDTIDYLNASYTYHLNNTQNPHQTTLQQVLDQGKTAKYGISSITFSPIGLNIKAQTSNTARSIIQLFEDEASSITIAGGKTAKIGTKKQTDGTAQAYVAGSPLNLDTANPPTAPNHATPKQYVDDKLQEIKFNYIEKMEWPNPNFSCSLTWEYYTEITNGITNEYFRVKATRPQ